MTPGLGSYVSVPCVLEFGKTRVGIPGEAFDALLSRALMLKLPALDLPSPFGRLAFIGKWDKVTDRLRRDMLPISAAVQLPSQTVASPSRRRQQVVNTALVLGLLSFVIVALSGIAPLDWGFWFVVGSLIFVAAVTSLQEWVAVRSIETTSQGVEFRYIGRVRRVPWSGLEVPHLPPFSRQLRLAVRWTEGSARASNVLVSLEQARAIFDHPSCPRFALSDDQKRVLGYLPQDDAGDPASESPVAAREGNTRNE